MAVTVGGYYNALVCQDVDDTDTRDVGTHNDAEIYFKGKGTTDGGIEIGFMVQLEAEGSGELTTLMKTTFMQKAILVKLRLVLKTMPLTSSRLLP